MATRFYLPKMLAAEKEIAAYIHRLLTTGCQKVESYLDGLRAEQPKAVMMACRYPISILFGKPGTGKTTTSNNIVRSFDKAGMTGIGIAPSAKAAKRMLEVVNNPDLDPMNNELECMTIHRALEYNVQTGGFDRGPDNPLDYDYVWLDEGSMADCEIFADLLSTIDPTRTRIFISGDPYQLPSVGPGNVLNDLIYSRVVPVTELMTIHRTDENSGIAFNAARILNGEMPTVQHPDTGVKFKDFYFVPRKTAADSLKFILDSVCEQLPQKRHFDPILDIQVLSPGKKSEIGVTELNKQIRNRLNPGKEIYEGFRLNDKVINRQNIRQLGIVNGDVGRVLEAAKRGMTVDFGPGAGLDGNGIVEFSEDKEYAGGSLHLAYCFTIHASQGSEFKAVLMPCHMAHYKLLFRNLIYTGATRARKLSCIIGDIKALQHAVETSVTDKRQTGLQQWLRTDAPSLTY